MKYYFLIITQISILLFSCGNKADNSNEVETNEEELLDTKEAKSIIKDTITFYNGNQKKIEVDFGHYFGFLFEADQQDLQWELVPPMNHQIAYVSESFEPEVDSDNQKANGKQYFVFSALKSGQSTIKFKSKKTQEVKSIQINIK